METKSPIVKREIYPMVWIIRFLFFSFLFFARIVANGQDTVSHSIFTRGDMEGIPKFPGGDDSLKRYIENCPYPDFALENHIEGFVHVSFVVDEDGKLSNFEIIRGTDKRLNEIVLDYLMKTPDWEPARRNGNPIKGVYHLPFRFNITEYRKRIE